MISGTRATSCTPKRRTTSSTRESVARRYTRAIGPIPSPIRCWSSAPQTTRRPPRRSCIRSSVHQAGEGWPTTDRGVAPRPCYARRTRSHPIPGEPAPQPEKCGFKSRWGRYCAWSETLQHQGNGPLSILYSSASLGLEDSAGFVDSYRIEQVPLGCSHDARAGRRRQRHRRKRMKVAELARRWVRGSLRIFRVEARAEGPSVRARDPQGVMSATPSSPRSIRRAERTE